MAPDERFDLALARVRAEWRWTWRDTLRAYGAWLLWRFGVTDGE